MVSTQAKQMVGLVREGIPISQAALDIHRSDGHIQRFGTCLRCESITDEAYEIDADVLDRSLIAEVGLDRIFEIAAEEGIDIFDVAGDASV